MHQTTLNEAIRAKNFSEEMFNKNFRFEKLTQCSKERNLGIKINHGEDMFAEDVLIEIDTTLNQLIQNAELIQNVEIKELSETEILAFQKTQESLLHRLLHLDQFFETRKIEQSIFHKKSGRYQIQQKLLKFERLKKEYRSNLGEPLESWHRRDLLLKRRSKRFLRDGL